MDSIRFAGLVVVAFAISFAAALWLVIPQTPMLASILPSQPRVEAQVQPLPVPHADAADSEDARDALRNAVLEAAKDLQHEPCNDIMKARYVEAATRYARAWLSIVPCFGTRRCGAADEARLDRVQRIFGTPLDHQAREAMEEAHETGALKEGDFPSDVALLVATFARDPGINPHADPKIKKATLEMRSDRGCRAAER
jgi:hypothetical protein